MNGTDAAEGWSASSGAVGNGRSRNGSASWTEPEPLLALSAREALTAEAVFERMFPADESGPGAREIGVVNYLDRALAGAYREHLPVYRNGLALLDSVSQARFGVEIRERHGSGQDELHR